MAIIIFNLEVLQDRTLRFARFKKSLDGTTYTFKIKYQKRVSPGKGTWLLSIDDVVDEIPIFGGVDITGQIKHLRVPQGRLDVVDKDNLPIDPNETSLGKQAFLRYTEAS